MKRRHFNTTLVATALATLKSNRVLADRSEAWSLSAEIAECCSCEIPCPCNFGRPTKLQCDGSRLIQITNGHVNGNDLAGISFVATFEMRKWVNLYVDETLSERQMQAFDAILPIAFAGFNKLKRVIERVPLTVKRSTDTVAFSVPNSQVEMKMLRGLGGTPITIAGLPSPVFHHYTQYESVIHTHQSKAGQFSHKGTNGFTSRMIVNSNA